MPNFSVSCTAEMQAKIVQMALKPSKIFQIGYNSIMCGDAMIREELSNLRLELKKVIDENEELKNHILQKTKLLNDMSLELSNIKEVGICLEDKKG